MIYNLQGRINPNYYSCTFYVDEYAQTNNYNYDSNSRTYNLLIEVGYLLLIVVFIHKQCLLLKS